MCSTPLENQRCVALECWLDSGCPWLYSICLGSSGCIAVSSVEQTGRKDSLISRAEAWNMKTAPVHVPGRGVIGSQESGPAIVCIFVGGCQEVWAA